MARARKRAQGARNSDDLSAGSERFAARGTSRTFIVILLFAAMAVFFLVRLIMLTVVLAPDYTARAQNWRTVAFAVEPRRGTIYDRNGHVLAISVDATTIYANPSEIKQPGATARVIAECLGGKPADYMDALGQGEGVYYALIKRKAGVNAAERLREALRAQELPGIYFVEDSRREYPYGSIGGQVIGAVDIVPDTEHNYEYYVGSSGLESYYNTLLSGTPGYYEAEVGADGTPIPGGVHISDPAVEGQDIVISLDIEFQEELEKALVEGLQLVESKSGTAVVMDVETGELYAAAGFPFFNPADRSVVPEGSMQLRAASALFEPGSIFKTVSAMAILEAGTMEPEDEIDCPAELEADGYIIKDAVDRDDTTYALRDIIAYSSNVGISLSVYEKIGFSALNDAIDRYNLNKLTGVDYPGEQLGYLLDFDYWSRVQGYNITFGQGISVNAFQMVRFYGAIANQGIEVTPHFLISKPQTGEVVEWPSEQVITNQVALQKMVSMLKSVVDYGTGKVAAIDGFEVAGKTSTAEIFDEENGGYLWDTYNVAFCGFLPNSSSKFVCFVGADSVTTGRAITPAFKDIMECAINRYNITPE